MTKKLFILIVGLLQIYILKLWFLCHNFDYLFHYSSFDLQLQLQDATNNDKGIPIFFIRFFHNKIVGLIISVFKNYLHFWDVRFAANFFSLIGYFALIYGFWHFLNLKRKSIYWRLIIYVLLFLPLIEVFFYSIIPYAIRLSLLSFPYVLFSLFGLNQFMNSKKGMFVWIVSLGLLFLSVWWLVVLKNDIYRYCIKT